MILHPDKEGNQDGRYNDIGAYLVRRHPVEHFTVVGNVHQHQQSDGDDEHFPQVELFYRNLLHGLVVAVTDDNDQDGEQQQNHHEVVHILPVVVIGKLCGEHHGELSPSVYQRVEIRIKFAADVLRTEYFLCVTNEPEHEKPLQKTDGKAGDNQDVGALRAGAYPTEYDLQGQVCQQQELGGKAASTLGTMG